MRRRSRLARRIDAADLRLFHLIADADAPALDAILPRLSRLADHGWLWIASAAALTATRTPQGRRAAVSGLVSLAATSLVVNPVVKLGARRARPPIDRVPAVRRLARLPTSWSFPSGHASSAAAFTTGVAVEWPAAGAVIAPVAAGVAYSRVHIGVHYPADVLAGVIAGCGLSMALRSARRAAPTRTELGPRRSIATHPGGEGVVVVVNVGAGKDRGEELDAIRGALPAAEALPVASGDDLRPALEDAAARAAVLGVAGGDGTIGTAAEVALASGVPLFVIPSGTANHFARDLGLEDLDAACEALAGGEAVEVPIGRVAGRPFVNTASLGSYPLLVDVRDRLEPQLGRWGATLVGLLRVLREQGPIQVQVDGQLRRLWVLFAGNGRYAPDALAPSRRLRLREAEIDLRTVAAAPSWSRTRAVGALLVRLLRGSREEPGSTAGVEIVCDDGPLRASRDGETFDAPPRFRIEQLGERLLVLVPPGRRGAAGPGGAPSPP
jgi:diacylglycerol kinase family enzyme/membrane-associated phospholipid phosphatase